MAKFEVNTEDSDDTSCFEIKVKAYTAKFTNTSIATRFRQSKDFGQTE